MSNSLWPREPQHVKRLCPPLSAGIWSNSYPLSQWCYLTISSSAALFFGLRSFPASGSFPVSQLFTSGGQSIGTSALVPVLPGLILFRTDCQLWLIKFIHHSTIIGLNMLFFIFYFLLLISFVVVVVVQLFSHFWLFCNPRDCNPSDSSVHGISQERILKWVAISFLWGILPSLQ